MKNAFSAILQFLLLLPSAGLIVFGLMHLYSFCVLVTIKAFFGDGQEEFVKVKHAILKRFFVYSSLGLAWLGGWLWGYDLLK